MGGNNNRSIISLKHVKALFESVVIGLEDITYNKYRNIKSHNIDINDYLSIINGHNKQIMNDEVFWDLILPHSLKEMDYWPKSQGKKSLLYNWTSYSSASWPTNKYINGISVYFDKDAIVQIRDAWIKMIKDCGLNEKLISDEYLTVRKMFFSYYDSLTLDDKNLSFLLRMLECTVYEYQFFSVLTIYGLTQDRFNSLHIDWKLVSTSQDMFLFDVLNDTGFDFDSIISRIEVFHRIQNNNKGKCVKISCKWFYNNFILGLIRDNIIEYKTPVSDINDFYDIIIPQNLLRIGRYALEDAKRKSQILNGEIISYYENLIFYADLECGLRDIILLVKEKLSDVIMEVDCSNLKDIIKRLSNVLGDEYIRAIKQLSFLDIITFVLLYCLDNNISVHYFDMLRFNNRSVRNLGGFRLAFLNSFYFDKDLLDGKTKEEDIKKKIAESAVAVFNSEDMKMCCREDGVPVIVYDVFYLLNVSARGKDWNYYKSNRFELSAINPEDIVLYFQNEDNTIVFNASAPKLFVRMHHLIDLIFDSDRKFGFKVIGIVSHLVNDRYSIKPLIIDLSDVNPTRKYITSRKYDL